MWVGETTQVPKNYLKNTYNIIKVEQGCGNCQGKDSKDCYACKENYCNEEKNVYKHCWENNGKICKNKYLEECFTERTKTNEGNAVP